MNEDTKTHGIDEANPQGANQNTPQGEGTTKPQVEKMEGKFTQEDLDNISAKARGTAERETKKKLLAELGLRADEEEKLIKFKQAYEASLSEDDRKATELSDLKTDNLKLSQDLEEKDYTLKALFELTGKKEDDVAKIVKMAKGLKTDENTIEDAIKEVISMVNPKLGQPNNTQPTNPNMPIGNQLQQPSTVVIDVQENPFKAGSFNLTKQGKLLKENPELAKKLAEEAGVKLKF